MNDDAFARLIAEDVKNKISRSQREYLEMPSNLHRWQRGLIALVKNLDSQIDNLQQDEDDDVDRYRSLGADGSKLLAEAVESYTAKKTKIKRFKFHVEKRLDEVSRMIEFSTDSNTALSLAEFLKAAILKHKELIEKFDIEPTNLDIALWAAAIENEWKFDHVEIEESKLYA